MFIVTGGGTGIGRALAQALAKRGKKVFICGRRLEKLQMTASSNPGLIQYMAGDLTSDDFQITLTNTLKEEKLSGLVQCAATLLPLSPIESMSLKQFQAHQKINVEVPVALFQRLRKALSGARVLHLSSLAAHKPFAGWGAYCMGKSSLYMLFQLLKVECPDIAFGSVMPGITDTAMQATIRQSDTLKNSDKAFFEQLYLNNALLKPEVVGQFLAWLLLDVKDGVFSEKEWDIYENHHHSHWLESGEVPII